MMALFCNALVKEDMIDVTFFNFDLEPISVVSVSPENLCDVVGDIPVNYEFDE